MSKTPKQLYSWYGYALRVLGLTFIFEIVVGRILGLAIAFTIIELLHRRRQKHLAANTKSD